MPVVIRAATRNDREDWAKLRSQLWPDCPPERHQLEVDQLLAGTGEIAIACVDGEAVGFAEVSIRADHVEGTTSSPVPYLEGWFVAEPFRGRGIGRALLAFAETWARNRGFREFASDADPANAASLRAHAKLGFREVGRSVHFVKTLERAQSDGGAT